MAHIKTRWLSMTGFWNWIILRWLKTQAEFYEYFSPYNDNIEYGNYIGAVNTSLLEEMENQYRSMVSYMYCYCEGATYAGSIYYYEVMIDKDT